MDIEQREKVQNEQRGTRKIGGKRTSNSLSEHRDRKGCQVDRIERRAIDVLFNKGVGGKT